MEVVATTDAIRRKKLWSNHHHQQNQNPTFHRPDALPVAQPTVSEHWGENITFHRLVHPKLTWGLPTLSLTTNLGKGLPCLSSALVMPVPRAAYMLLTKVILRQHNVTVVCGSIVLSSTQHVGAAVPALHRSRVGTRRKNRCPCWLSTSYSWRDISSRFLARVMATYSRLCSSPRRSFGTSVVRHNATRAVICTAKQQ